MRARGFNVDDGERTIRYGKKIFKRDLFRFIDIVAIGNGEIYGVQTTTFSHTAERRRKILSEPLALEWLRCTGRSWLVSWPSAGKAGSYEIEEITPSDFGGEE